MESSSKANGLVQQLVVGFDALQQEYRELHGRYSGLERKLQTARAQYNELAKLLPTDRVATPPLSLSSSPRQQGAEIADVQSIADVIQQQERPQASDAAEQVRLAVAASQQLREQALRGPDGDEGVKIWSGPSADQPEKVDSSVGRRGSSMMPSISESPLEQDFTIEGKPSRLGCPFASMAGKKLSSHAASVLSRYNTRESPGAGGIVGGSAVMSSAGVSRVNGRESWSRRESRRESFRDPIKAEICGLSDHNDGERHSQTQYRQDEAGADSTSPGSEHAAPTSIQRNVSQPENAEPGVCPIRFLDQHSPEEVATYFENHKHELPRSHEVCVKRYQSNEEQIRELDAKYGNLVSMIQGLGKKHKDYLPNEPDPDAEEIDGEEVFEEAKDNEKVRKWASSVSAQAPNPQCAEGVDAEDGDAGNGGEDERVQHFARPLRDIRVGESPSRPWGIPVPARYLEKPEGEADSDVSSRPVQISAGVSPAPPTRDRSPGDKEKAEERPKGRCPFGFDKQQPNPAPVASATKTTESKQESQNVTEQSPDEAEPQQQNQHQEQHQTIHVVAEPAQGAAEGTTGLHGGKSIDPSRMVFTGPVFIGYSAEDAARILRESGLGQGSDRIMV